MLFELTVLGSSGGVPAHGRFCSSQLLRIGAATFLIDCGEGCQMRLQQYGSGQHWVRHIFISHLHGDHIYGLPGLLSSWALSQRTSPLTIHSPPGLRALFADLLKWEQQWLPFSVEFNELSSAVPTTVLQTPEVTVTTLPLVHRVPTVGYLFREPVRPRTMLATAIEQYQIPYAAIPSIKAGSDYTTPVGQRIPNAELTVAPPRPRSYAYCSDTRYHPPLADQVAGVDMLYHEATFAEADRSLALQRDHSTAQEAALLARSAGVGRLLLGHFSARYRTVDTLIEEAKAIFPATVATADGERYAIPFVSRPL